MSERTYSLIVALLFVFGFILLGVYDLDHEEKLKYAELGEEILSKRLMGTGGLMLLSVALGLTLAKAIHPPKS